MRGIFNWFVKEGGEKRITPEEVLTVAGVIHTMQVRESNSVGVSGTDNTTSIGSGRTVSKASEARAGDILEDYGMV